MQSDGDGFVSLVATRLTGAGYVLDADRETWRHRETNRMLDAGIAETLTFEQLLRWIVDGHRFVPWSTPRARIVTQ